MVGLRERKRAETRQRISDRATRLFERHGFENVTLAQVAAAAEVSVKTVVNYFGAKEDLFFDAEPAIRDALVAALAGHSPPSATAVLRPMILDGPILAGPCRWDAIDERTWEAMRVWAECEQSSPTLTSRRAAILQSWMEPLAVAGGSRPWAAMTVGVLMLRHDLVARGLLGHDDPATVEGQVRQVVGRALDALERGFRHP
ncbi:TetR family transcriptional regulator [Stackebrandtia endophytica]|uniref:TetR family transcriptional regulator n=1 Tax=Stackebrandtia endophytica TaxID=1496996 RepID=A0A543B314_9ACTN|nr:TetR/AcrR family transcriptional regulator [Stackebrandtia endophytica]TQL79214.1 TetR family transcriptional regulator [Stackebrandtia endophytica]